MVFHSFESGYVARADVVTVDSIYAKLAEGLYVTLTAGIFNLLRAVFTAALQLSVALLHLCPSCHRTVVHTS